MNIPLTFCCRALTVHTRLQSAALEIKLHHERKQRGRKERKEKRKDIVSLFHFSHIFRPSPYQW